MDIKKGREVALKKDIDKVLRESSILEESTSDTKQFARVNLIATIVMTEKMGNITNILLDDGSGRIVLRCFEENKIVEALRIGESVLVIGRVRKYNGENYVSPEIVRKISPEWLRIRALELGQKTVIVGRKEDPEKVDAREELLPRQKIIQTIKLLDSGEGVMIGEVIEKVPLADMERWVTILLEEGDIYQIRPGRVKVL